jgi:hypothetical protein
VAICAIGVVLHALYDAKYGNDHDLISVFILLGIIGAFNFVGYLFGLMHGYAVYIAVRFALFDYVFSYRRYGHIWYLGDTSVYDRLLKKFNKYLLLSLRILGILVLFLL